MIISMAAPNFWNDSLSFQNLDSSLCDTNPDVVVVETILWVYSIILKMMIHDRNVACAGAEGDERGEKALIAARPALSMLVNKIKETTGWDIEAIEALRTKAYADAQDSDALLSLFTNRVLRSVGKQSIDDEDTNGFGHFALEDGMLYVAIQIFFIHIPSGYYEGYKQLCAY